MTVYMYMVGVYAFLIKAGRRTLEGIPEEYQKPVAEFIAEQEGTV